MKTIHTKGDTIFNTEFVTNLYIDGEAYENILTCEELEVGEYYIMPSDDPDNSTEFKVTAFHIYGDGETIVKGMWTN